MYTKVTIPKNRDNKTKILWVDDVPENNFYLISTLERMGVAIDIAGNTQKGVELYKKNQYDLIISDLGRNEEGAYNPQAGIKFLRLIRDENKEIPFIIFTNIRGYSNHRKLALSGGANKVICDALQLLTIIKEKVIKYESRPKTEKLSKKQEQILNEIKRSKISLFIETTKHNLNGIKVIVDFYNKKSKFFDHIVVMIGVVMTLSINALLKLREIKVVRINYSMYIFIASFSFFLLILILIYLFKRTLNRMNKEYSLLGNIYNRIMTLTGYLLKFNYSDRVYEYCNGQSEDIMNELLLDEDIFLKALEKQFNEVQEDYKYKNRDVNKALSKTKERYSLYELLIVIFLAVSFSGLFIYFMLCIF